MHHKTLAFPLTCSVNHLFQGKPTIAKQTIKKFHTLQNKWTILSILSHKTKSFKETNKDQTDFFIKLPRHSLQEFGKSQSVDYVIKQHQVLSSNSQSVGAIICIHNNSEHHNQPMTP